MKAAAHRFTRRRFRPASHRVLMELLAPGSTFARRADVRCVSGKAPMAEWKWLTSLVKACVAIVIGQ